MIYSIVKMTIRRDNTATLDRKVVVYKGDKNVEIQFEIVESIFKQYKKEGQNVIENLHASYGQLVIIKPNYDCAVSEIAPTKDGRIVFVIPNEMTDENTDIGPYTFQIRMFDESMESRVTLPPVIDGLMVLEAIVNE